MKFSKYAVLALSLVVVSGCAGLSQHDRDQTQALKDLQKAHAKVERKEIKLGLATTAAVAAAKGMVTATGELKEAKVDYEQSKVDFCKVLDCSFPDTQLE